MDLGRMTVEGHPLLGPREHRLHRTTCLVRERGDDCLETDEGLRAEGSPHRGDDHPDLFHRDPEDGRKGPSAR